MQILRKFAELSPDYVDPNSIARNVFKSSGTVLIIDFHNLMFRTVFGTIVNSPEDNEDFFLTRHNILEGLYYHIEKIKPSL